MDRLDIVLLYPKQHSAYAYAFAYILFESTIICFRNFYFFIFFSLFLVTLRRRKVQHGQCTYIKSDYIDYASKEVLVQKYTQFHAAHPLIVAGTKVTVTRGNKIITVTIDSCIPTKDLSLSSLELSDEAANALDIWKDGTVDCDLQIESTTCGSSSTSIVVIMVISVVVVLIIMAAVMVYMVSGIEMYC